MLADFPLFPAQGSSVAPDVDALFFFILAVSAGVSGLIAVLLVVFAIRFRRRSEAEVPKPIVGSARLEVGWIVAPMVVALVMFVWGARVYLKVVRPPEDATEVYVVARQWMWKVQHPGGAREVNALHVPVGRPVRLIMTSEDVIHSFYVPEFRIKQDVVPGRYTTIWFEAAKPGTYHLFCAEYCGTGHSQMTGEVIALDPEEYQRWLGREAEGSMALEGRKLFLQLQCVACHSADSGARGPVLEGIYRHWVPLTDGGRAFADENYLRESVLKPEAKVAAGFEPIMPTYQGQLDEEQLQRLIAFLKALGPGETPPRVEDAAPPEVKPKSGDQPRKQP